MNTTFGDLIRRERLARHWTQAELALRIGCREYQVSLWERGHFQPSEKYRGRLIKTLAITPDSD